jgi:hypothetical protein
MVAFIALVVEAKRTNAIDRERQAVLEFMPASMDGRRNPRITISAKRPAQDPPLPKLRGCPHVGILTNIFRFVEDAIISDSRSPGCRR